MTLAFRRIWILALLASLSALPVLGRQDGEDVLVETTYEPTEEVWVGQRVSIYVELASRIELDGTPRFDLPELDTALLRQSPGSPLLGSRRQNGAEYVTRRYEFLLFPRAAGTLSVPSIGVRVTTESGGSLEERTLASQEQRIEVGLPPGAEPDRALVTSTELDVSESWTPAEGELRVGDAVVRTIRVRATDVIGLALPPAPPTEVPGFRLYTEAPRIEDTANRGELTGERTDTLTYMCQEAGRHTLPALAYTWWNPRTRTLERKVLPARQVEVLPGELVDPVYSGQAATDHAGELDGRARSLRPLWVPAAVLALVASLLVLARRQLAARVRAWRDARALTEPALFEYCLRVCREHDAPEAYSAFRDWRDMLTHELEPTPDLRAALGELELAIVERAAWNGASLAAALRTARTEWLSQRADRAGALGPLNPA